LPFLPDSAADARRHGALPGRRISTFYVSEPWGRTLARDSRSSTRSTRDVRRIKFGLAASTIGRTKNASVHGSRP
jgi:hypothetical protein